MIKVLISILTGNMLYSELSHGMKMVVFACYVLLVTFLQCEGNTGMCSKTLRINQTIFVSQWNRRNLRQFVSFLNGRILYKALCCIKLPFSVSLILPSS